MTHHATLPSRTSFDTLFNRATWSIRPSTLPMDNLQRKKHSKSRLNSSSASSTSRTSLRRDAEQRSQPSLGNPWIRRRTTSLALPRIPDYNQGNAMLAEDSTTSRDAETSLKNYALMVG